MKRIVMTGLLVGACTAFAKFDANLKYAVSASDSSSCITEVLSSWDVPGVVGVDSSTGKYWNLFVKASPERVNQGLFITQATVLDFTTKKLDLMPEKKSWNLADGSKVYHFKVPFIKAKPKQKEVQKVSVVLTLHVDKNIYDFATNIAIVNNDDEVRTYRQDLACARSLPATLIRDNVKAPPVVYSPQDVQFNYEFVNEFELRNSRLTGIVTLGYYRNIVSKNNLAMGGPSASMDFHTVQDYANIRRASTGVAHTFKIRPNTIGYIVGTHAEFWVPYKDVRFDRCGKMDVKAGNFLWENRILPAFAMLVTEPEHEGDYDYLEQKLEEYPKFNTCKERF